MAKLCSNKMSLFLRCSAILADRPNGRTYATVLCPSVCRL